MVVAERPTRFVAPITVEEETPPSLPPPRLRRRWPNTALWIDLPLVGAVVALSLLARIWLERMSATRYQEFLRLEWVLVAGGKGLQLDPLSLPLPPLLFTTVAAVAGLGVTERWLPILLSIGILLVLTRVLLRDQPLGARFVAAVPLLASPLFYLLQRQLDLQLYVLLLGLQLSTLRAFRRRPTVARVTIAVALNVLLSLTSYAALVALVAAVGYLLLLAERQGEIEAAAWRALLWLYIPFSLAGYLIWGICWLIAGTRVKTSYFVPQAGGGVGSAGQFFGGFGGQLALPLLLLLGLVLLLRLLPRHRAALGGDGNQVLAWSVLAFMTTALGLLTLQTTFRALPVQAEVIAFTLVLLVPAAIGSVYGQARDVLRASRSVPRMPLVATGILVIVLFPLLYVLRPALVGAEVLPVQQRASAEREAAAKFAEADPGGRILIDPRFAATFVLESGIDPHRLLTPFDQGFERLVADPPSDVSAIVVSDTLEDFVAGNHPALRLLDLHPGATLVAKGDADGRFVRAFRYEHFARPEGDAPRAVRDPALQQQQEDQILAAILAEMERHGGLPLRPDGWAYAVDMGNLLVYAAERGDKALFQRLDELIERYYLVTKSDDPNALYTIAWRARMDRPAEASGTTETLRMVEAYWIAGERWDNEYYRRLAHAMARAYMHHQWSDEYGEGWFIRNYYNYGTKGYATNTFLVDYHPDILRRVADHMEDPELRAVADKSAEFVGKAQMPYGFFHEMYQPEIGTLYQNITYFSPNGILQIIDSHEAALGICEIYAPDRARLLYQFVKDQYVARGGNISNQYRIDGQANEAGVTPGVYAFMARLSVKVGDPAFARQLIEEHLLVERLNAVSAGASDQDGNWFFLWTSALQAIEEYQRAGH